MPVSLALNYVLDPILGAVGAAISILAAELIIFTYQFKCIRAIRLMLFPMGNCVKIAAGNICAIAATVVVTRMIADASILIIVAAQLIVYFTALVLTLVVMRESLAESAFKRIGNGTNSKA